MRTRIPSATYRLQMNADFRFDQAARIVAYLDRLGITDVYLSPILKARAGSSHGYDAVDYNVINPELGGEDGLKALSDGLREKRMGLVADIVPNHMGIMDEANHWWWDVLENGPGSPYAPFFDIDWRPPKEELWDRVLLPTLGQQFGACLENQELRLVFDGGEFTVCYYDKRFPTGPRTWTGLLLPLQEALRAELEKDDEHLTEFESILTSLHYLPLREDVGPEKIEERQREKEVAKRRLRALTGESDVIARAIAQRVEEVNGRPGDPASFDTLDHFLDGQAYRLAFWRTAAEEINYRRFFDINELAAIRVELPEVFTQVHETVFRLIQEGIITGLRVDHPDGLFNPPQYFMDLQRACHLARSGDDLDSSEFPADEEDRSMWVVVEKILARQERLRPDWVVSGTTGYEYLNLVNGLFVDPRNAGQFFNIYSRFTGERTDFSRLMYECKKLILDTSMAAEINVLSRRLDRISEQDRWTRDFTLGAVLEALSEFIAWFPVYRSYIPPDSTDVGEDDARYIRAAIRTAKRRNPSVDPSIYDFISSLMLLEFGDSLTEEQRVDRHDFALRLQQLTGPVMAKGLEDTAFYRVFPLSSLNEVGGEPNRFGVSLEEFHARNSERLSRWPHSMITTSTHDTKRSEDVRTRIDVLSEMPNAWEDALNQWSTVNAGHKIDLEGVMVPTPNEEYLIYQTLLGAWPLEESERSTLPQRIKDYMTKAGREAKVHTSWISINTPHEDALHSFVEAILEGPESGGFLKLFEPFQKRIAPLGALNSLSQLLLKATSPGVPDFYRGTELWDLSLVDPDNRRPVDYDRRERVLDELIARASDPTLASELVENWTDGRIKLHVIQRALTFRRAERALFDRGAYIALSSEGQRSAHICAFARRAPDNSRWAVTIAPCLMADAGLPEGRLCDPAPWGGTALLLPADASTSWTNILTGARVEATMAADGTLHIPLETLLGDFPVALLVNDQTN